MKRTVHKNFHHRVVVTGLGVVSSLGIGWQGFWKNLLAGKSGTGKITAFDTSDYDCHYGGEVRNFDPTQFMSKKKAQQLGRASQMALAAAKLAIQDARLRFKESKRLRTGVCIGTTMGEPQIMERVDEQSFSRGDKLRYDFSSSLRYPANSISSSVAYQCKLKGPITIFSTACAAGNYAIARSYDLIKTGECDCMLAGGSDALSRIAFTGFGRLYAMAPEKCQPFDKNRQGIIVGEGAAIIVLESLESAQRRGAPIYAEILGYGMSCDAYTMTEPSSAGIVKTIQESLRHADVAPSHVDYISAHGTGTINNDIAECRAINRIFAKRQRSIPVSAIKSMLGHTMGASAAFGALTCCLVLRDGKIPPTIHHDQDDPQCTIDCVPNVSRPCAVRIALNNSQAFGGNNACLVLSGVEAVRAFDDSRVVPASHQALRMGYETASRGREVHADL